MNQQRKLAIAGVLLLGGVAHTAANWESFRFLFGSSSVEFPNDETMTTEEPVSPSSKAITDPSPAATSPPSASDPDDAFRALTTRFLEAIDRRLEPTPVPPRHLTPFHSPLEVTSGVPLEALLTRLTENSARPVSAEPVGLVSTAPMETTTPPETAVRTPRLLRAPEDLVVSAILVGKSSKLCVIDGRRLSEGDRCPGTIFHVLTINERTITLSDGSVELEISLAPITTSPSGDSTIPRPRHAGSEDAGEDS